MQRDLMYRNKDNYLRFGTNHIFINFTDANLKDMEVINNCYGKGIRTKKVKNLSNVPNEDGIRIGHRFVKIPIWSGKIHIFIDYVNINVVGETSTFALLSKVKQQYGSIFKIYVHLYSPLARKIVRGEYENSNKILYESPWTKEYYRGLQQLMKSEFGMVDIIAHKHYVPVSFEEGFTKITVQHGAEGLEVVTHIMTNKRKTNVFLYAPYRLTPVYDRRNPPPWALSASNPTQL